MHRGCIYIRLHYSGTLEFIQPMRAFRITKEPVDIPSVPFVTPTAPPETPDVSPAVEPPCVGNSLLHQDPETVIANIRKRYGLHVPQLSERQPLPSHFTARESSHDSSPQRRSGRVSDWIKSSIGSLADIVKPDYDGDIPLVPRLERYSISHPIHSSAPSIGEREGLRRVERESMGPKTAWDEPKDISSVPKRLVSEKDRNTPENAESTAQKKLDSLLNQIQNESCVLNLERDTKSQLTSETALRNWQSMEKEWRKERTRLDSKADLQRVFNGLIQQVHCNLELEQTFRKKEETQQANTIHFDALTQTDDSVKCDAAVNAVEVVKEMTSIGVSTTAPLESVTTGTDPLPVTQTFSQTTDTQDLDPIRLVCGGSTQTDHGSLETVSTNTETSVALSLESLETQTETRMTVSIGLNTFHRETMDSDTQTQADFEPVKGPVKMTVMSDRDRPFQSSGMVYSSTVEDIPMDGQNGAVREEYVKALFEQDPLLRVLKARLMSCEHDLRWDLSL